MTSLKHTTVRLYRLLMRECNRIDSSPLYIQRPLDPRSWGVARQFAMKQGNSTSSNDILTFLDSSFDDDRSKSSATSTSSVENESFFVAVETLKQTIRDSFRYSSQTDNISRLHRRAIDSIRLLKVQMDYQKTTSICYDPKHHMRVFATSIAVPTKKSTSLFAYRIRIENFNPLKTVQLLGRSWWITPSSNDNKLDIDNTIFVHAPTTGAVGHYPALAPQTGFEYMSGTDLQMPTGSMNGLFHMAYVPTHTKSQLVHSTSSDGDQLPLPLNFKEEDLFQIEVAPFALLSTSQSQKNIPFHQSD
jgi:uncharacterized protein affecting Mg2+/Co2+ transport